MIWVRLTDSRSLGTLCIKGTGDSLSGVGSPVLLSDLICIILKEWALLYEVNFHCQARGTIKECNAL